MAKFRHNLAILLLVGCLATGQSVTSGTSLTSGLSIQQSGPGIIPASLFGLHFRFDNNVVTSWPVTPVITWPGVPFGSQRLWDVDTRWQNLNLASGVFNFAALDQYLAAAKVHSVDVLMTLSATPEWAATNGTLSTCDYSWFNGVSGFSGKGLGDCSPPADLNFDGTGSNQHWRDYMYNLGLHLKNLNASTYAPVSYFELWNEFTRGSGADSCTESASPAAWLGSCAELARLAVDADCILTGRGSGCNASAMNEPAVGLLPAARMATADAVPQLPDVSEWGAYLATGAAMTSADVPAVHAYAYQGPGTTWPENIGIDWAPGAPPYAWDSVQAALPGTAFGLPVWSTEGSWATSPAAAGPGDLPDPDMQEGYIPRYYLVGWSIGYRRLYWYAYNNSWGRLAYQNGDALYATTPPYAATGGTCVDSSGQGCLTKAATGYRVAYDWMVGAEMTIPCTPNAATSVAVWTCGLVNPLHQSELAVWDATQSCLSGSCTTSTYTYPTGYGHYQTLDDYPTLHALTGGTVAIGWKPILLVP